MALLKKMLKLGSPAPTKKPGILVCLSTSLWKGGDRVGGAPSACCLANLAELNR